MQNKRIIVLLSILVISVFSGSIPPVAKFVLGDIPSFTLVMLRFLFAAIVLLPFLNWKHVSTSLLKDTWLVGVLGALNPIVLFVALQFTRSAPTPIYYAGVPALTALYYYLRKQSEMSPKRWFGVCLGFFGVLVIFLLPLLEGAHFSSSELLGNGLIIVSVVAFMAYGISSKTVMQNDKASPLYLTTLFVVVGFILSLPLSLWELFTIGAHFSSNSLLVAAYLGVCGTGVFYLLYQKIVKQSGAVNGAVFTFTQPIFTALFAIILLGEVISGYFLIGAIMALVGAYFSSA